MSHLVWRSADDPVYDGPLLLDTHIWVWMVEGVLDRCSRALPALLDRCATQGHLSVSDISFWEVAHKEATGKLVLTMPIDAWAEQVARVPGIQYSAVDRRTLITSTRLLALPGDPADRILAATAKLTRAPLVTIDRAIIDFARREGATPVCDARR